MSVAPRAIREIAAGERESERLHDFRDKQPVVMRGLVAGWPAVHRAAESAESLVRYLSKFDCGKSVDALLAPPEVDGRIFYNESMTGFNFVRNRLPLSRVTEQVLRYAKFAKSPAVAAQSALLSECLPGFATENSLAILDAAIEPRIWLGNRITTPTHVDEWNNIGCVVAGRRRFTLFPPEQIENLYIGPLDFAPTGAPMSMVSPREPDLARYPRFQAAADAAFSAELCAGDAIFIPPLWWHHVESLDSFNVLVNYWWHDVAGDGARADSAFDALLHSMLSIRSLPPATRRAWSAFFEHYVFGEGPIGHIPAERHGILGTLNASQLAGLRAHLADKLTKG